MCIRYICTSCQHLTIHHCVSADSNQVDPACFLATIDPDPLTIHKRCHPCKTVEAAIAKLHELLYQQPWLATEGLGGGEKRATWECEQETDNNKAKLKLIDWDEDGDEELWDRLRDMGLQELEGKDTLNDGHGITEFGGSEKTSWTHGHDVESSDNQMQASLWGSEEGTLATDEQQEHDLKSAGGSPFNATKGEEEEQLVGIGGLFE